MSEDFAVPFGQSLTSGRLVSPREASKSFFYKCPSCASPLVLKKGAIKAPHFSHPSGSSCSSESYEHKVSKLLIADIFRSGSDLPFYLPCKTLRCRNTVEFSSLLYEFDSVEVERSLPSGLRPDVLLLDRGVPVFAFEVFVSHRVSESKCSDYPIPFIEFDARAFLRNKTRLVAISSNLPLSLCHVCESVKKPFLSKTPLLSIPGPIPDFDALRHKHLAFESSFVPDLRCLDYRSSHGSLDGCPYACFFCKGLRSC